MKNYSLENSILKEKSFAFALQIDILFLVSKRQLAAALSSRFFANLTVSDLPMSRAGIKNFQQQFSFSIGELKKLAYSLQVKFPVRSGAEKKENASEQKRMKAWKTISTNIRSTKQRINGHPSLSIFKLSI